MNTQLIKSTSLVGLMTFISRILGYIRDMVAAHYFGASDGFDAFLIAFKIPNFLRRLFAEGAFSQAFVPMLAEYKTKRQAHEFQDFINKIAGTLSTILLAVSILGMLVAPLFIYSFAPGFSIDSSRFQLATSMLRITFPYILFISLTAFSGGILNCMNFFVVPAFTPIFLNLSMIVTAVFLAPYCQEPIVALAWGVLFGGIAQLLFQIPFLYQQHLLPKPKCAFFDPSVKRLIKLMVPALFGVSVNQLNLLIDSAFASFLPTGSVSWLYYSERLMEFPMGVFGVAISTVILPSLSKQFASSNVQDFSKTINWGLKSVILLGVPSAIGLFLLAEPLLATLFKTGYFSETDVIMSGRSLKAYAIGIIGFMLVKVLAAAFYAQQDIKTPVKIAACTMLCNVALNALFVSFYQHAGLALATSIAALCNALFLFKTLKSRKMFTPLPGWFKFLSQTTCANIIMGFIIILLKPNLTFWFNDLFYPKLIKLFSILSLAVISYGLGLLLSGLRLKHLTERTI